MMVLISIMVNWRKEMRCLEKTNLRMRANGVTWRILRYLYYAQFMLSKDIRLLCRDKKSEQASTAIKRLKELCFVEERTDILPVSVIYITKLGRIYVCDKLGNYSYESTYANRFTVEYDTARRRNEIEKYVELQRVKAMLSFQKIIVWEKDKPSLKEFVDRLSGKTVDHVFDNAEYPPYKNNCTDEELQAMAIQGVFYSKREIIQWMSTMIASATDIMRAARFKGVFINTRRILMIYVQPFQTGSMFRLNYEDALSKNLLERNLNILLPRTSTEERKVQALIISDRQGLIQSMATGWKNGVLKSETKANILKMKENQSNRPLHYGEKQIVVDSKTSHKIMDNEIIPTMNIRDDNDVREEREKLQKWYKLHQKVFSWSDTLFEGKYVVSATTFGLFQIGEILFNTDDEIYREGIEKYKRLKSSAEESQDKTKHFYWIMDDETETVVYLPVYEIDRIHALSCDGQQYKSNDNITIICNENMIDVLSHCIRKKVKGYDLDTMEQFEFVKQYNYDGYVTNAPDPYESRRVPSEKKKRKIKSEKRGSFVTNEETMNMIKRAATRLGVSINEFLVTSAYEEAKRVVEEEKSTNQKYPKTEKL